MLATIMRRGRTWPWIRMRPFLAGFSEPVWSGHLPSWADFITTTAELKFSVHTGKFSLLSFWTSAIPFAALPNIQDIVGAAIADTALSIRRRFAGASHVSEIDGTPRSVSIDLGTESMPELGSGTKRRASVTRAPPWSADLWAAPSRAG